MSARGFGAAGLAAFALMAWITARGLGATPDSEIYVEMSRNLLAGHGFYAMGQAVTHVPPGYPILLALTSLTLWDVLESGRWLQAILFGTNAVLCGLIVYRATERNVAGSILVMLLFCSSAPLLMIHSHAWSEGAFLSLALTGVLLLAAHVQQPRSWRLMTAALAIGIAIATRYVGAGLLLPLLWGAFTAGQASVPARFLAVLRAALVACAPIGLWLARNLLATATLTNHPFLVHVFRMTQIRQLVGNLVHALLPIALPFWLQASALGSLLTLGGLGLIVVLRGRGRRADAPPMSVAVACLGLLSAAGYVIVLGISFSFFEITTSWDQRIVAPLFVFITIACVALTWQAARILRARALWWLAVALLLSSSVLNARAARSWAQDAHRNGQGYASTAWRESATIAFVRTLPTALKIYSNDPYAIRFLTGKDAMMIPLDIIPRSGQPNPAYTEELKSMCRASQADEAVLVWLEKNGPWFQATRGAFESTCPTRVRRDLNDGTVYGGARPQASSGPTVVDPPVPRR